ncbi:hypothetical protein GCM10009719_16880 [Nocardioides kribbensis]
MVGGVSASCQAVVADFAWFSQTCPAEAVKTVQWDDQDWHVCAEHLAAFQAGGAA